MSDLAPCHRAIAVNRGRKRNHRAWYALTIDAVLSFLGRSQYVRHWHQLPRLLMPQGCDQVRLLSDRTGHASLLAANRSGNPWESEADENGPRYSGALPLPLARVTVHTNWQSDRQNTPPQ